MESETKSETKSETNRKMESEKMELSQFNQLTEIQIKNILSTVDSGLSKGLGIDVPGKMCVEAAVCYGLGLPHSDYPICVGHAVREFKITLNDSNWSSNLARAQGLRKLAIAQLGSDQFDQNEFTKLVLIETIRQILPILLEKAGFLNQAEKCRKVSNIEEVRKAIKYACDTIYPHFCFDSVHHIVSDVFLVCKIAHGAIVCYDCCNMFEANYHAANIVNKSALCFFTEGIEKMEKTEYADKMLNLGAQICLDVLTKLESPGCKFLYLCE